MSSIQLVDDQSSTSSSKRGRKSSTPHQLKTMNAQLDDRAAPTSQKRHHGHSASETSELEGNEQVEVGDALQKASLMADLKPFDMYLTLPPVFWASSFLSIAEYLEALVNEDEVLPTLPQKLYTLASPSLSRLISCPLPPSSSNLAAASPPTSPSSLVDDDQHHPSSSSSSSHTDQPAPSGLAELTGVSEDSMDSRWQEMLEVLAQPSLQKANWRKLSILDKILTLSRGKLWKSAHNQRWERLQPDVWFLRRANELLSSLANSPHGNRGVWVFAAILEMIYRYVWALFTFDCYTTQMASILARPSDMPDSESDASSSSDGQGIVDPSALISDGPDDLFDPEECDDSEQENGVVCASSDSSDESDPATLPFTSHASRCTPVTSLCDEDSLSTSDLTGALNLIDDSSSNRFDITPLDDTEHFADHGQIHFNLHDHHHHHDNDDEDDNDDDDEINNDHQQYNHHNEDEDDHEEDDFDFSDQPFSSSSSLLLPMAPSLFVTNALLRDAIDLIESRFLDELEKDPENIPIMDIQPLLKALVELFQSREDRDEPLVDLISSIKLVYRDYCQPFLCLLGFDFDEKTPYHWRWQTEQVSQPFIAQIYVGMFQHLIPSSGHGVESALLFELFPSLSLLGESRIDGKIAQVAASIQNKLSRKNQWNHTASEIVQLLDQAVIEKKQLDRASSLQKSMAAQSSSLDLLARGPLLANLKSRLDRSNHERRDFLEGSIATLQDELSRLTGAIDSIPSPSASTSSSSPQFSQFKPKFNAIKLNLSSPSAQYDVDPNELLMPLEQASFFLQAARVSSHTVFTLLGPIDVSLPLLARTSPHFGQPSLPTPIVYSSATKRATLGRLTETKQKLRQSLVSQLQLALETSLPDRDQFLSQHCPEFHPSSDFLDTWSALQAATAKKAKIPLMNRILKEIADHHEQTRLQDFAHPVLQPTTVANLQHALSQALKTDSDHVGVISAAQLFSVVFDRNKSNLRKTLNIFLTKNNAQLLVFGTLDPAACDCYLHEWFPWNMESRFRLPPCDASYEALTSVEPAWLAPIMQRKLNKEEIDLLSTYQPGLVRNGYIFAPHTVLASYVHTLHISATPQSPFTWNFCVRNTNKVHLYGLWQPSAAIPSSVNKLPTSESMYALLARSNQIQLDRVLITLISQQLASEWTGFFVAVNLDSIRILGHQTTIQSMISVFSVSASRQLSPQEITQFPLVSLPDSICPDLVTIVIPKGNILLIHNRPFAESCEDAALLVTRHFEKRLALSTFGTAFAQSGPIPYPLLTSELSRDRNQHEPNHFLISAPEELYKPLYSSDALEQMALDDFILSSIYLPN